PPCSRTMAMKASGCEVHAIPRNAKIYIALIVTLGFALVGASLVFRAEFPDLPRYFRYLLLAVIVSHFAMALARTESLSAVLALSACVFFASNTLLISSVLCLLEGKPLRKIWQQYYLWSFPYYLVGSAIAGLVTVSSRAVGWRGSLLVLPLMYLVYTFYRLYLEPVAPAPDPFTAKSPA